MRFDKLIKKALVLGGITAFVMLFTGLAGAAMVPVERNSTYMVSFDDFNDFANPETIVTTIQTWQGNAGNTALSYTFGGIPSDVINFTWCGDAEGNVEVSSMNLSPALGLASADITAVTGLTGYTLMSYNSGSLLSLGVSNGLYTLGGSFSPRGGVYAGGTFTFELFLPGDWSGTGVATGSHQLLSYNNLWTIQDNFVFDGGQTIFSAVINGYVNDGSHDPGMNFVLYGGSAAPVPVPAPLLLLGSGLLGLIGLRKRAGR